MVSKNSTTNQTQCQSCSRKRPSQNPTIIHWLTIRQGQDGSTGTSQSQWHFVVNLESCPFMVFLSLKSFSIYLICSDEGRLGNLMSQYGSLYGMARLLDVRAAITDYHKTILTTLFPNISMPMYSLDHVNCSRYDRHRWLIFHEYVKPSRLKKKNVILGDRQEYSCSEHVQTCLNIWFPGSSYRKWSNSVGICWPMTFK